MASVEPVTSQSQAQQFEPLLDSEQAARLLRIHPRTLTRMARKKEVPAFQIGKLWRFRLVDLDEWMKRKVSSRHSSFRRN